MFIGPIWNPGFLGARGRLPQGLHNKILKTSLSWLQMTSGGGASRRHLLRRNWPKYFIHNVNFKFKLNLFKQVAKPPAIRSNII
jgi:hypothetical protein